MELARGKGAIVQLFRGRQFQAAVLETFPDLRAEIGEDDGIHIVMSALERAVMESLRAGNDSRARAVVGFLDALLNRADLDPEIPNAIAISFVEPVSLESSTLGRRLWEDMPERIRQLMLGTKNVE
jgi:hypothetical protein